VVIDTRLGPLEAEVTHDSKDRRWWAFLTRTPVPLRHGGPTMAAGSSSSVALTALTAAIDEFVAERSA
jgi:hypothetical protein